VAASVFHFSGYHEVTEINDAYYLLAPLLGTTFASIVFGLALFASGQSSTITGTMAGRLYYKASCS
jgi:manganese transport protein